MLQLTKQKYGIGYSILGLATLVLFGVGVYNMTNFLGIEAAQEKLTGKILVENEEYSFDSQNQLMIDNNRNITGKANGSNGEYIYFDTEGGEVNIDQLDIGMVRRLAPNMA
jgi:hypothetical protein